MVRPWKQGVFTFADQAVVSLVSAVTTIIVGRTCSLDELGVFVFGVSLMWRAIGLPVALVWSPYASRAPHLTPASLRRYAGSSAAIAILLSLIQAVVLLIAYGVLMALSGVVEVPVWIPRLVLAMAPLLLGATLREHARRTCIADFRGQLLLAIDLPIALVQVSLLALLWRFDWLDSSTALLAVALATMLSIAWFVGESRRVTFRRRMAVAHLRSNFGFGVWLLAIALAWLVCDLLLRSLLTGFHGIEAMGTFGAAYTIVGLINPIVNAATIFCRSWAARVYAAMGLAGLRRFALIGTAVAAALALLATALLTLFGEQIVELLFKSNYASRYVMGAVTLGFCLQAVIVPVEAAQMALERGRELFVASFLRVAMVFVAGIPLVWWQGAAGIGWTTAVQSIAVLSVMWFYFLKGNDA
ncbi:MATE family efflux transporter [Aeoliella mucimassa]|uniref:hypothetical protein n=1 Tax=Aeoliella mucimassa TaxID=2527972 RepID=UPI00119F48B2|nr:hypothetical protein [Aeoliella mucimassa]